MWESCLQSGISTSLIHLVFHVSLPKEFVRNVKESTQLPLASLDVLIKEPEVIMVQRRGRATLMVLVKWSNEPMEEAPGSFYLISRGCIQTSLRSKLFWRGRICYMLLKWTRGCMRFNVGEKIIHRKYDLSNI